MALTTLQKLKQYLGITTSNDDALLTELVASANAFVLSYIGRDIEAKDYVEKYNGTGSVGITLDNDPIISIAAVAVDGRSVPVSTGHDVPGYFFVDSQLVLRGSVFTRGKRNVDVSYRAGFDTVPADIMQAANYVAAQMYKRRDRIGVSSKTIGQETISYDAADLDTKSRGILNQYKKRWLSR